MSLSLDGLVSGLSTTELISQLMQVESIPQTALKNKVTTQNKVISAYQSINARMAALTTAAKAVGSADTWTAMKATSSSDAAVVTAKPGAAAGSLTFKVDKLAAAHTVTFAGRVTSLTDGTAAPVISGATFEVLREDGTTTTVTPTDASLQSVVKKINETANAAYTATALQVEPGKYTLQLTAKSTGAGSRLAIAAPAGFSAVGLDNLGAGQVTTAGTDAQLTVGSDITYTMKSATNTFADVLPGVSVTVTKVKDTDTTINIASDKDGIAAKVQAMVDAANYALSELSAQGAVKKGNLPAGTLAGDALVRRLSQEILGAVAAGAGSSGTLSEVGVKLEKSGTLSFNKETFLASFAKDPVATRKYFDSYDNVAHAKANAAGFDPGWDTANGLGRKLEVIGLQATEGIALPTDPVDKAKEGLLPGMIKRKNEFISRLNEQVSAWDLRLDAREAALKKQFSNLEVALGKLQQQSSWLSGQIASLPSSSSS